MLRFYKIIFCSFLIYLTSCGVDNKDKKTFKTSFYLAKDIPTKEIEDDLNKVMRLLNKMLNTKDTRVFHDNWNNNSKFLEYSWSDFYTILDDIPENYQPILMMFQKANKNKYLLKIAIVGEYKGGYDVQCMYNLFAIRDKKSFKLNDLLSYNLRNWKNNSYNNINYYFKTEPDNLLEEQKQQELFEQKIVTLFGVEKVYYKYIICEDNQTIYEICGFDYEPSMNGTKHGGMSIPAEKIIFAGNNSACYPHELVHIYTNEYFPDIHNIIDEGVATYLGGSLGLSYVEQKQELKKSYEQRRDRKIFEHLMNQKTRHSRIGEKSSLLYAGGALICDLVHTKLGDEGLTILMSSGKTDEQLIATLENLLNVERAELNNLLMNCLNNKK